MSAVSQPPDEPYDPNATYPAGPTEPYQPAPLAPYPAPPYPMAGYGYGYGYRPDPRPGTVIASAVLGYVTAGLLILAGLLLFFGASFVSAFDDASGQRHTILTTELVVDGLLNIVVAGLLIGGAASFAGGSRSGRTLLSVGCGIVLVEAVYWAIRTGADAIFWVILFGALAIVPLAMGWTNAVTAWLRTTGAASPPMPPGYPPR